MYYELIPTDSHKSFYKKAIVHKDADGTETLYSYGTPVIRRNSNGTLERLWWGWSATTGRHIKSFCGLCKQEGTGRDGMQIRKYRGGGCLPFIFFKKIHRRLAK